jgi:hypothetical protein
MGFYVAIEPERLPGVNVTGFMVPVLVLVLIQKSVYFLL